MRDIVSCFGENAVNVSHSSISCSNYSNNGCISPSTIAAPSTQNSISNIYKLVLSTLKEILITVTWIKSHSNQGLTITFNNEDPPPFRLNTNSRFFRKKKGTKLIESSSTSHKIEILWDLTSAKYESGPEPVQGFYVVIIIDSEIGLVLGDSAEEIVSKRNNNNNVNTPLAKVSLLSRREHCSGNTLYTTKAQFCDTGTWHDVMIRCSVEKENEGLFKSPVLCVCIDKKTVIRVKRLQWNFRGNQTIFVDGLLVDLLWDVHDWFFNPSSGYAVFMFRTRNGMDSRLWLEEKSTTSQKDKERVEFSLLIYACKTSS